MQLAKRRRKKKTVHQPKENNTAPVFLLKNWKAIGISVLSLLFVVSAVTFYLFRQTENLKKANQKLSYQERVTSEGLQEMKKSFVVIDSALHEINQKMRKRGLEELHAEHMGGPIESEESIGDLSAYYKNTLKVLDEKLSIVPVGMPYQGEITSSFFYRSNPFTHRGREFHSGIDIRGITGEPAKTTADGVVRYAGYKGSYGYVVMVEHEGKFETRYAHLSKLKVKKGDKVNVGDTIGLIGSTGRSTGPHLHYEILHKGKKIDPQTFIEL